MVKSKKIAKLYKTFKGKTFTINNKPGTDQKIILQ